MPSCPCCFPETAHSLCARFFWNNDSIARAVFRGGVQPSTAYSQGTCFKTVMMGHSSALSSVYPNPLLSVVARKFRSALVMSVVGAGVRYEESQWQRGPEAALIDISKEQVIIPWLLPFCVLVCMCDAFFYQNDAWDALKWNASHHCSNHTASQSRISDSAFCHRILVYNKTSGYSTSATQRALADACAAVPLLLQVLVPSRSCYLGLSVSIWLIFCRE